MSLFRNITNTAYAGEFNAVAESTFTDDAMCQLTMELFHIAESADLAGVMGAWAVQEGATEHSSEVLLENIIKTSYNKMKEAFKKFAAKMKAFFEQVRKVLKSIFLKGKEFVKEFKAELTKKSKKGFKYTGFVYKIEAGDTAADKMFTRIEVLVNNILTGVMGNKADYKELLSDEEAFKAALGKYTGFSTKDIDDYADGIAKSLAKETGLSGVSDITDLKAELKTLYRDKSESQEEVDEFDGTSVSDMCAFIEASETKIKGFDKAEKDFDRTISKIIKVIDGLDNKKGETEEETNAYKLMSKLSSKLTTLLNSGKAPIDVKVEIYKEAAAQYERVLKSFLRYKAFKGAVKESYVSEGMSLAQQMLGL